ncbi:DUF4838 domain-containing protein [Verrucomicrobiota bacterium]
MTTRNVKIRSGVFFLGLVAAVVILVDVFLFNKKTAGVELVEDGRAVAEIVISTNPMPQVKFAAVELRDHIKKISGAELPIVTKPGEGKKPIYVGESDYTRQLGLTTDDIEKEGFKIIATGDYLALMGRDAVFPFYPRGHTDRSVRPRLLAEWQEYAGEKWDFPFQALYEPRHYNPELGFSLLDPSGTLFAVYEFLEQLGVRWYMPYHDFGTVIPKMKNIAVKVQNITRCPEFERRFLRIGWGKHMETFLWFKRQKLGVSELAWMCHGTPRVTRFTKEQHPEYLAVIGGRLQNQDAETAQDGPGISRLAPPLRDAMIRYGDKFLTRYPELRHFSAAPNDGYLSIDDRDKAAGWMREEHGSRGRMSDYVWTFLNEVARGVVREHPDKIVMGLAYSGYRMPPPDIPVLHSNVGVTYCQSRSKEMFDPDARKKIFKEREEWLRKIPSGEFYLWEYFLWHQKGQKLWGVPVIFTGIMQEDMQALQGKSKGEYVECWGLGRDLWGINHLMIYLQARLYWDPDLDLKKLLDEYYTLFYGPAAAEMREFFDFAEEVWVRPESRDIMDGQGFLKPDDVSRYFAILERAQAKAGDSVYGKRIGLIAEECLPMREIFAFQEYYEKGKKAAKAKDGKTAAEYLRKAVASAQDNRSRANAAYDLGNVYRNLLQDNEGALEAYRLAMQTRIEGAGSAVRSHARMACVGVLSQEKRYDEALKLLDEFEGARRHGGYWRLAELNARGRIAEDMGRPEEAMARYQEALEVPGISSPQAKSLRKKLDKMRK